jgi:ferredoxin--NADP+ reductase
MSETEFEQGITDTTQARVVSSTRITPDTTDEIRQLVVQVPESSQYFMQGQSVGVLVPGPHPFGNKYHHRYYTIANSREAKGGAELELLVRRCFYIDEVSGERYPGVASNHLCDARPGDAITLTGPYRSPFRIPPDNDSNLLLLGTGTGIAPFRAFLRRIYEEQKGWKGKVRLYYGARNGTELLYMNDHNSDLTQYYDEKTFQAIQAVHNPLLGDEGDALGQGIEDHAKEIWKLIQSPKTHVYLAGLKKIAAVFDGVMAKQAGSEAAWQAAKDTLLAQKRWTELTYH